MKYKLKNQINNIAQIISKEVIERDTMIKLSILGIFAKESMFLLGPPGVGKSLISRKISSIFKNAKEFSVLMNKFSLPDEIFGPIDINELKEGNFKRKIKNYLPDANIAFLDEIWKASSSIQNTLLTILNEKIFNNDGKFEPVDLYFTIAASNELPERNQSLEALWDRFLLKFYVGPITSETKFWEMITNSTNVLNTRSLTPEEQLEFKVVNEVFYDLNCISVSDEIKDFILELKAEIEESNNKVLKRNPFADGFDQFYVSDRKWKKILTIIKTAAYLNERLDVNLSDFGFLPYMLWNNLEQLEAYKTMVWSLVYKYQYTKKYEVLADKLKVVRNELISFTTATHLHKKQVIETHMNSKGVKYYRFLDSNKNIYYFLKEEMDSISTKARFSIDWLISYVTQEQFDDGYESSAKLLVKYDNSLFYIYEENDESKPSIQIFTNFETVDDAEYELVKMSSDNLNKWQKICADFEFKVKNEMDLISKNLKDVKTNNVNIFWDHLISKNEEESGQKAIDKLEELIKALKKMDQEKDLLKIGFSITSLEKLYEINFETK